MRGRKAPKYIVGRNAGKDPAGTQGWARTAQVAMPGEASGDARLPSVRPVTASSGEKNSKNTKPVLRGQFRLLRAEEPSLGTVFMVRVTKIGFIEAGYLDLVRKSEIPCRGVTG